MTALAAEALATVRAAGGDVRIVGPGRLKVIAPVPLPDDLVGRLRTVKPELLVLLSRPNASVTEIWDEAKQERAAIVEYDGCAPRVWAEALARLNPANPPGDISLNRWLQFINDCGLFLDNGWAARAVALGWGPLDLFGCNLEKPLARISQAGLLWLLEGKKLLALTADTAVIATESGSELTFYRRQLEISGVLAWELSSVEQSGGE